MWVLKKVIGQKNGGVFLPAFLEAKIDFAGPN